MVTVSHGRRTRPASLALAALVVAACGGGLRMPVDSPLDGRAVAAPERGTTTDKGGVDADGRTAAPGGGDAGPLSADASPSISPPSVSSTVELRLVVPPGGSYCDQRSPCEPQTHISILDEAGRPLTIALAYCALTCSPMCIPPPCPPIGCDPVGASFSGEQLIWDGQVYGPSTCGVFNTSCHQARYAPVGRYLAVMCATPGRTVAGDGGPLTCQPTGARTCIEVPFDFPSPMPVVGHLP
jgi:hypothetical protein